MFRPLATPGLTDGQRVRLEFEADPRPSPEDLLQLAASVYDGLSAADILDVETTALRRNCFFSDKEA